MLLLLLAGCVYCPPSKFLISSEMTKNKHADPDSRHKRKKIDANDPPSESNPGHEAKKKRKKDKLEQVPSVITNAPIKAENETQKNKKNKKSKKKKAESAEISDPPNSPEEIVLEGEEDLAPEEKRVLERKMKKIFKKEERKRLREQGETEPKTDAAGPTVAQLALDYLTCWAENRSEWKFQKIRQTWLLQHMFDCEKISDDKFSVLLEYLEGLRGTAKNTTIQKALALVQQSGEETDDATVQQRAHRAREVIQLLS